MSDCFYYEKKIETDNPEELLVGETLFHNANGYIGVRGNFEEGYPEDYLSIRGQYINAFYDITDMKQAEALCGLTEQKQTMTNIADTQTIEIWLDGEKFSLFEGTVQRAIQALDMRKGVTIRQVEWLSPKGKAYRLQFKRMTSFTRLPLFLQEISVEALNHDARMEIHSGHCGEVKNFSDPTDPRVGDASEQYLHAQEPVLEKNISYIVAQTSRSGLQVCSGVGHKIPEGYEDGVSVQGKVAEHKICGQLLKKQPVSFYKYSWFADSERNEEPLASEKKGLQAVMELPVDELYQEQERYLRNYWGQSELTIQGDEDLNRPVHSNQYALLQSVGKDAYSNIAAKGLSGEGYEGHFFWDTEMYSLPCFLITYPELARNLLSFRYRTLEQARENARKVGHTKGALYPWRTINGEECSGYFPSGTAAYHINGDIAYAVVSYYLATGDIDYLCDQGAEILMETARLWIDTGNEVNGQFHIQDVTGPDEYTCIVNNNYYTNAVAKYNLEWAVKCKELLTKAGRWQQLCGKIHLQEQELLEFAKAAETMYLPYDEKMDINPQDDSFLLKKRWDFEHTPKENYPLLLHYHPLALYRKQVCKQADTVLAHFILEDYQKLSTMKNSFLYYETLATHDSSLSTCIFSIMASKLGMKEKAYHYFGESAKLDLFNTHKNTRDGIHTANMGGNYMAVVYGFAGLRIKEGGLFLAPCIPEQWENYAFRMVYHGKKLEIKIDQNQMELCCPDEQGLVLRVYDKEYYVQGTITIPLEK